MILWSKVLNSHVNYLFHTILACLCLCTKIHIHHAYLAVWFNYTDYNPLAEMAVTLLFFYSYNVLNIKKTILDIKGFSVGLLTFKMYFLCYF